MDIINKLEHKTNIILTDEHAYIFVHKPLTLDKCKNDPRYGTSKYEDCRLARRASANRKRRMRRRRD